MSKKVRRVKQTVRERQERAAATAISSTPARRPRGRIRKVTVEELREEYAYVIKDLRRIFYLAIAMFALLIAANILLPYIL